VRPDAPEKAGSQRLGHDRDILASLDGSSDGVGVLGQASALVVVGQPHPNGVVATLLQLGDNKVPDPRFTAGTRE